MNSRQLIRAGFVGLGVLILNGCGTQSSLDTTANPPSPAPLAQPSGAMLTLREHAGFSTTCLQGTSMGPEIDHACAASLARLAEH